MKTISRVPYVLSVCAAAAMLAGCGGSTQLPNPTAQTPGGNAMTSKRAASPSFAAPQRAGLNSSGTEVLTGMARVDCHHQRAHGYGAYGASFSASGMATGPNPGTFNASGSWSYGGLLNFQWVFTESFAVTSKSRTINGTMAAGTFGSPPFTCREVKNLMIPYTSGSVTGNAEISIRQGRFREDLLSF